MNNNNNYCIPFSIGINAEKSHLLQTVISNIEAKGNYYQEITLPFVVKKNDLLFKKLEESKYQF